MNRIGLVIVAIGFLCASVSEAQRSPIRVAILDGQSAGAYHNWRLTTPVLKKELEETRLFEVTVITAPAGDGDFSNFKPDLSQYQVIVMNYDGPGWPADLREQFESYVNGGG